MRVIRSTLKLRSEVLSCAIVGCFLFSLLKWYTKRKWYDDKFLFAYFVRDRVVIFAARVANSSDTQGACRRNSRPNEVRRRQKERKKKKSERDTSLGFTLAEPFVRKLASLSVKSARRFCTERAGQIKMKTASRRRRDCATQVRTARVKKFTFLVSDKYDKCHRSVFSCNSAAKISPVRKPEPAGASSFIDSPKKQLTIAC